MPVALRGQMRGGTIIPLAVPVRRRTPEFSDVPTLHELGFPALVVTTWFAIAAPAGLPRDITERVNQEIATALAALAAPAVRDRLAAEGFELATMSPPELTAFVQTELAKWGPVAKKLAPDAAR
ncbi:MAG: Bug family tripartite tricarboxylate transporter substrate binding protein [Xanthobacteraceae bacterium]